MEGQEVSKKMIVTGKMIKYSHVATTVEIHNLSREEIKELSKRIRIAPLVLGPSLILMAVVDNVAYDIN